MPPPSAPDALVLDAVTVRFDGTTALRSVSWRVAPGERWVVVGANGSGKTTLLRLSGGWIRPSTGTATVLGQRLGRTDVRDLRRLIGFTSQALTDQLRPAMTPHEIVLSARHAALETWWHQYDVADRAHADAALAVVGIDAGMAHRSLRTLSAGERQRVLLARAFAFDPALVVLDEPTAGLDVGGREALVHRLDSVAARSGAAVVLVTHHLEEIPASWTHGLALDAGEVVAAGPIDDVLTGATLSGLYGLPLEVTRRNGRWSAVATGEGGEPGA